MNHKVFGAHCRARTGEPQERTGGHAMTRPARFLRFAGSSVAACQFSAVGAVSLGALALMVACNDSQQNVTGPPASTQDGSLVNAHKAAVVGDVVVMHRSTQIAAHNGVAKVNRNFTEKLGGQIRSAGKDDSSVPGTAPVDFAAGALPRPVTALPARTETGMCAALPAWSRGEKNGAGGTAKISGVGDGPASLIEIVADDGTVLNIERKWVRTSRTWQLARQTTTTPDKRFRDEIVYEHQSVNGESIDRALPIVACADNRGPGFSPDRASSGFYAPHVSTVASRLFPLSEGATTYSCGDGDCFDKQTAVYTADVALTAAATTAAYACVFVMVVTPATCLAAGVAYGVAVANLALAQRALNHCLYMLAHPNGEELRSPGWNPIANPLALSGRTISASLAPDSPPAVSADCGGGTAGGGSIDCHSEDWEISYDGGATWNYLTTVTVCENVL